MFRNVLSLFLHLLTFFYQEGGNSRSVRNVDVYLSVQYASIVVTTTYLTASTREGEILELLALVLY
jgi:hypothetical protein